MPLAATEHPTDSTLTEFVLGKLPDETGRPVERHLAGCPTCQARAAAARPADTLVALLAAAGTRGEDGLSATASVSAVGTPDEFASTQNWTGGASDGPAPAGEDDSPPAALVSHPRYRPVRQLGRGGMGVVWLAEYAMMGRRVALKVIRPGLLARPGAVERFRREVHAAAQLNHPHIATAYDADEAGGVHFLVMEYVPGETLLAEVRRGPLAPAAACRAARDAARGVAHAHAAGFVHRDVKPSNLIRAADGSVKVLDFGLAGRADAGSGPDDPSGRAVVMGTPDYVAPEQATDASAADARSDIYSLGCTLYHLLAGRVPYPAASAAEKLGAHRAAAAPAPVAGLPAGVAAVLARMLAKNPADRYQTAGEAADALDNCCDPPEAARRRLPRRSAAAAGLFAAAAVLALGVVYKVERDREVVTVETDDPDIEVVMKRNGDLVRIVDAKTKQAWDLDTHKMRLTPGGGELSIDLPGREPLVIRRAGDATLTIRRTPPAAPAVVTTGVPVGPAALLAVTDFREAHGVNPAGLRRWLAGLPPGFRPVELTARVAALPPLFDAVAVRDARDLPAEAHLELVNADRPGPYHLTDFHAMAKAGWALRASCPYDDGADRPRHHVWVRDGGRWVANGFPQAEAQDRVARWRQDQLRPTKLYLNAADPGRGKPDRPFGVLLADDDGLPWEFTLEVSPAELPVKLADARARGRMPDCLAAVGAGPDRTYALSVVPNPHGLAWEWQSGLTAAAYEATLAAQKTARRRPLAVASEGAGAAARYAALWVEYSPAK